MGDWEPDTTVALRVNQGTGRATVYAWTIPAQVAGRWTLTAPEGRQVALQLWQRFQRFTGPGGTSGTTGGGADRLYPDGTGEREAGDPPLLGPGHRRRDEREGRRWGSVEGGEGTAWRSAVSDERTSRREVTPGTSLGALRVSRLTGEPRECIVSFRAGSRTGQALAHNDRLGDRCPSTATGKQSEPGLRAHLIGRVPQQRQAALRALREGGSLHNPGQRHPPRHEGARFSQGHVHRASRRICRLKDAKVIETQPSSSHDPIGLPRRRRSLLSQ
jgi:hypothetical protein